MSSFDLPGMRRRPLRPWRIVMLVLACLGAAPEHAATQSGTPSEYDVKAAFLYNFARFSEWPADLQSSAGALRLCVIGADPFGGALGALAGKPVGTRPLEIMRLGASDDARRCHVAFVGASTLAAALQISRRLDGQAILTVAEVRDFARSGGMIEFTLVDGRIKFMINPAAAQRARLVLSSQLLRLATVVEEDRP